MKNSLPQIALWAWDFLMELGRLTLNVGGTISWASLGTEEERELTGHKHVHILCLVPD